MQTGSFRVWNWVPVSILWYDNHYIEIWRNSYFSVSLATLRHRSVSVCTLAEEWKQKFMLLEKIMEIFHLKL